MKQEEAVTFAASSKYLTEEEYSGPAMYKITLSDDMKVFENTSDSSAYIQTNADEEGKHFTYVIYDSDSNLQEWTTDSTSNRIDIPSGSAIVFLVEEEESVTFEANTKDFIKKDYDEFFEESWGEELEQWVEAWEEEYDDYQEVNLEDESPTTTEPTEDLEELPDTSSFSFKNLIFILIGSIACISSVVIYKDIKKKNQLDVYLKEQKKIEDREKSVQDFIRNYYNQRNKQTDG